MNKAIAIAILAMISYGLPIRAEMLEANQSDWRSQLTQLDSEQNNEQISGAQVVDACVTNQADRLPHAFVDVPSDHWAFKAVQTMYYCGAYRQATPIQLQEELKQRSPNLRNLPDYESNSVKNLNS